MTYSDNTMATIMLCSPLGLDSADVKTLTLTEWNTLVSKISQGAIQEPANLMLMNAEEISRQLDILPVQANRIVSLLSRGINITFLLEKLSQKSIYVTTRGEASYPVRLRKVLGKNAPPLLYYCGDLSLANCEGLAMVGSRNVDADAADFARQLAFKAATAGYAVFSGGAKGVDSISEQAALDGRGCCISILADSLERKIRNQKVCNAVIDGKMLLLSATIPSARFQVGNAMTRNNYIYALSRCAVVVASDYNKGGTWAGAVNNIKNKWVKTYVLDTMSYLGNRPLISKGGIPLDRDVDKLSIQKMLIENIAETPAPNKYKQQNLNDSLIEQQPEISNTSPTDNNTVYNAILPILLACANEPMTIGTLAEQLGVLKKQAEIWVKMAVEAKKLKKMSNPVRYIKN